MTDAGPRSLAAPYGMTPGVRAVLPGINDQQPMEQRYGLGGGVPYGMEPGRRHVIPDQIDLDSPPAPDAVNLDAPATTQKPIPEPTHTGWEVRDPHGRTVMHMPLNPQASKAYQGYQVTQAGKSLLEQAVTPAEKEAANRALAWGMSRIGTAPVEEVTKELVHRYDTDMGNSTKVQLQDMRTRNRGGGGKGGPVGPSKADKFTNQVDMEDAKLTEAIVNNEQQQSKVAALRDYESDLEKLEQMISSGNALSERGAIAEYLKTLTGKQSTDRERQQITGAAGKLAELQNNLSLWSPTDASLSRAYVQEFKKNLAVLRSSVSARKQQIGKEAGDRLTHQPRFAKKDADTKKALSSYGKGVVTGEYDDNAGVDEDLLK